jgi:glycosyltransferase involved in cell wall biosynthesis
MYPNKNLSILQVSTRDIGGAERIANNLHLGYLQRGQHSRLAVGHSYAKNRADLFCIDNNAYRNVWARFWLKLAQPLERLPSHRAAQLRQILCYMGQPDLAINVIQGKEFFDYPGSRRLLDLAPEPPDIVHLHNLHGDYFDLRILPELSRQKPLFLTLHDMWLLTGHCVYSLDCERWQQGCGSCPYLNSDLKVLRDNTAYNWQRKREIYAGGKFYVATPSRWLMSKVEKSMLAPAVLESQVIPYGIDLQIFKPVPDRTALRVELDLPLDKKLFLFTANNIRKNMWKGYGMFQEVVKRIAEQESALLFLALGADSPPEKIGQTEIRFIPFEKDPVKVAKYYQAVDFYLHPTRADTFPTVVLEALACGTPVIATAVGGVPEQVLGANFLAGPYNTYSLEEATGVLTQPGNVEDMTSAILCLLKNEEWWPILSRNATDYAQKNFGRERMVDNYLDWYWHCLEMRKQRD